MEQQYNSDQAQAVANNQPFLEDNGSGLGWASTVPSEIKTFNYGAFLLTWIWGIKNRVWISLLALIPGVSVIIAVYLGVNGSEKAWKERYWKSTGSFASSQRRWAIAGLIIWVVIIATLIPSLVYFSKKTQPAKSQVNQVTNNHKEVVQEIEGIKYTSYNNSCYSVKITQTNELAKDKCSMAVMPATYSIPYAIVYTFSDKLNAESMGTKMKQILLEKSSTSGPKDQQLKEPLLNYNDRVGNQKAVSISMNDGSHNIKWYLLDAPKNVTTPTYNGDKITVFGIQTYLDGPYMQNYHKYVKVFIDSFKFN